MYKIKLISPLVISFILLIVMIGIIYIGDFTRDTMELTDVQVKLAPDAPEGNLLYELTFDNMVKKYSSNIVVGKVQEIDNSVFLVDVIENVLGDLENIHSLLLPEGILKGRNYILFLQNTEDGSVQISTRRESIIRDDALNYHDTLKELKEIQRKSKTKQ